MNKNIPTIPNNMNPGELLLAAFTNVMKAAASREINTRRVKVTAKYNQGDFSENTGTDIESMTYTDSAGESSDSVDITINAQDSKWLKGWLPEKGASIKPNIVGRYWKKDGTGNYKIKCGLFVLDDVNYADRPSTLQIGGVSKPANDNFSEKEREKVWKNTTIKRIANTIAKRYKLKLTYDAEDYKIKCYEQDGTDGSFLNEICGNYGLILKIYAKRLWIYDREQYKKKRPVKTYKPEDIVRGSLKWNTTLSGTYTGGEFSYTDSDRGVDITAKTGKGNHILSVNQRASSVHDAAVQLCAALNAANHGSTKVSFQVAGEWKVCSGHVIRLTGYGKANKGGLNGKYFVDKVTHNISADGGFTSDLECSLIEKPFKEQDVGGKIKKSKNTSSGGSGGGGYSGGGSYNYQTPSAAAAESDSKEIKAGDMVVLNNAPWFERADSIQPMTVTKSGTYYFWNGKLNNGRYMLVNTHSKVGQFHLQAGEAGYVPEQFCKNVKKIPGM